MMSELPLAGDNLLTMSAVRDMPVLGIDVSKQTLHLSLRIPCDSTNGPEWSDSVYREVTNDAKGFRLMARWLTGKLEGQRFVRVCVVLEPTGPYWIRAARFLHQEGHRVCVENPTRVAYFAKSELRRPKSDEHDAMMLAEFAIQRPTRRWAPLPDNHERLRDLSRCRDRLSQEIHRYKNIVAGTREMCQNAAVIRAYARIIKQLEKEVARMADAIHKTVTSCPRLSEDMGLLCSIPGIGPTTAILMLAELPPVERFTSARQLAAYVGVTPSRHESGTSVRRRSRICKTGAGRLRKGLFYPAMVARRYNPTVAAFADRLETRNKAKMQILMAVENKLLRITYGVLKHRKPFDPNHAKAA